MSLVKGVAIGHAAIKRVVQMTWFDALERIKRYVDRDPVISGEVRKELQRGGDGRAASAPAA